MSVKKRIRSAVSCFLILALIIAVTSGVDSQAKGTVTASAKSLTIKIGSSKTISVTGDGIKSVKYKSTKKSIATVNGKGVVKAKKIGSCEIKITVMSEAEDEFGDTVEKKTVLRTKITSVKKSGFSAAKIYKKLINKKKKYPEGKSWDDSKHYVWNAVSGVIYHMYGCAAFASILSDAAFGKKAPAKIIKKPSASKVRVGDILRVGGDSHSVIVLKVESDSFVIAEGNYGWTVHWGRVISKKKKIDYLYTRYDG